MAAFLFLCFLFCKAAGCLHTPFCSHMPSPPPNLQILSGANSTLIQHYNNVKIINFPMSAHMFIPEHIEHSQLMETVPKGDKLSLLHLSLLSLSLTASACGESSYIST